MTMFVISFLSLYSLLHLYVFMRARSALALGIRSTLLLAVFMFLMIASPVIVRQLEKYDIELPARIMANIGYTWLGFLFLLICCLIVTDVYRLCLYLAGLVSGTGAPNGLKWAFSSRTYFVMALLTTVLISIYGSFEARQIHIKNIVIKSNKIPARVSPLRIAQISDVHIGLIVRGDRVRSIIDQVKRSRPDLFLSTGDLVDGDTGRLARVADILGEVNPRYGKYAITGNHEFYAGIGQAVAFTKKAGFTMLRGERTTVGDFLNIVGVDDPAGPGIIKGGGDVEKKLLAQPSDRRFTLLLKHRPDVEQESLGKFDLQLSGHLHKGQIFPFRYFVRFFYPMYSGFYVLDDGSSLYVSTGSGTWGPPIRFLAPPEVTLIELAHAE